MITPRPSVKKLLDYHLQRLKTLLRQKTKGEAVEKSSRSIVSVVGLVLAILILVGLPIYLYNMVAKPIKESGITSKVKGVIEKAKQDAAKENRLQSIGITADALILQVSDAGFATKRFTQLILVLKVTPKGKQAFKVTTKKMISHSHLSLFQPGASLQVKYDPADLSDVSLLSSPRPAPLMQKTSSQRLEQLEKLRKKGLITDKEYKKKRDEILHDL